MEHGHITGEIVRAAMKVHSVLGPGLLESAYRACLKHELLKRGLEVQEEVPVRITYDGVVLAVGYRMDLLVEKCVVVELKTVNRLSVVDRAQLLSQLRLSNNRVGLLINFHVARLKNGIRRVVN